MLRESSLSIQVETYSALSSGSAGMATLCLTWGRSIPGPAVPAQNKLLIRCVGETKYLRWVAIRGRLSPVSGAISIRGKNRCGCNILAFIARESGSLEGGLIGHDDEFLPAFAVDTPHSAHIY